MFINKRLLIFIQRIKVRIAFMINAWKVIAPLPEPKQNIWYENRSIERIFRYVDLFRHRVKQGRSHFNVKLRSKVEF